MAPGGNRSSKACRGEIGVADRGARRDHHQAKPRHGVRRQVFQAVDGQVDPPGEQLALKFLREEALAADRAQRRELLVAAGRHGNHFHFHARRPQLRRDPFGLPLRQHARSGPKANRDVCTQTKRS